MLRVIQILLSNTNYSVTKMGRNTFHYLSDIYEPRFFYNSIYCVSISLLRTSGYCHSCIWQKFDKIWDEVPYTLSKPTKHKTLHLISPVTWIWQHRSLRVFFFFAWYHLCVIWLWKDDRLATRHRCVFRWNVNYSRHKISSQNYWTVCNILTQQREV